MTSCNPTIFQKAIAGSDDDREAIARLAGAGQDAPAIVDALIIGDIRDAADVLRPVWERSHGRDGFVSIEVAPGLARDTRGSSAEAHRGGPITRTQHEPAREPTRAAASS